MTEPLFREDSYLERCEAEVVAVTPEGGVVLDRTVFYAQGGGQPGDSGLLRRSDGSEIPVANAVYGPDRAAIVHVPAAGGPLPAAGGPLPAAGGPLPAVGERVIAELDWEKRLARMQAHTALHLLSVVLPYPVTGGSVGDGEGRLDFDIQDAGLDKAELTTRLQELIDRDAPVSFRWITDAELDANPGLVKTMSVKPPRGSGRVRLVEIDGIDLQPCGGTHVRRTGEIGRAEVTAIEKKGKQNRRVRIKLG